MSLIHLSLLGGFRAAVDGKAVSPDTWGNRRAVQLVKLLGVSRNGSRPRDAVLDLLWSQLDPDGAAAQLHKAASLARKALGATDAVAIRGGRVSLGPDVSVDVSRFETAAIEAGGDPAACAEALAFYAGPLLPDDIDEPWTAGPRTRLAERYRALLRSTGRWQALLQADPTDEEAFRALADGAEPRVVLEQYERLE
ncbi:MAG: hypothetical protein JRJ84_22155, partial [Deltaproteobacteria bacterium]|nr:hypothetical protein [Deltaproteobacteria bacterium]